MEDHPGHRIGRTWLSDRVREWSQSDPSPNLLCELGTHLEPAQLEVWLNTPRADLGGLTPRGWMAVHGEIRVFQIIRDPKVRL